MLAGLAHERELGAALSALEDHFSEWRAGRLSAFELGDLIHTFHDGTVRELYKRYVVGQVDWAVAYAVAKGLVKEAEAGDELELLAPIVEHLRAQKPDEP